MRFISPLERFPEDFLRERTPCTGVLYASPFHSLSIYTLHLSFFLSLSYFSLPLYISPSLSLLSIILFGVSNGRFSPCLCNFNLQIQFKYNCEKIKGRCKCTTTILKILLFRCTTFIPQGSFLRERSQDIK